MIVFSDKVISFEGCDTTLWGVGFVSGCKVKFSGSSIEKSLLDVSDERIVFKAPAVGSYTVYVEDSEGNDSNDVSLVVMSREFMPVNKLIKRDVNDFTLMLKGLLPRGFIWNFKWSSVQSEKTNWQKLLESIAGGISNVWNNMLVPLVSNSSPAITSAIVEWESELGLPRNGLNFDTDKKRSDEIYRVSRGRGGNTIPFLKSVVELFGLDAEIYEYFKDPDEFPQWVKDLGDDAYMYSMIKVTDGVTPTDFDCESSCEDYLSFWWNQNFENAIEFDKLAHVKFIFVYE